MSRQKYQFLSEYDSQNKWWGFFREAKLYFPSVDVGGVTIIAVCCVPFLFVLFMKDEMTAIFVGTFFAGLIQLAARAYNERQDRCAAKLADENFKKSEHHP
jgi:hypothetical protein